MEKSSAPAVVIRFGPFGVDTRSGELFKNGLRVRLQDQPFQVLMMLLEHPGEVITRDELRSMLWPGDTFVDFDTGLNTVIKKLRDALGDSADNPQFVETLPRRGYRFVAHVDRAEACATRHGIRSIAVLPLENLNNDPSQEYFADGMTDALITSLAQIRSLRVISRTSVMQYKSVRRRLPIIAAELNVDAVVEGTVLRSGERVRIQAQLIQGRTDTHLWAGSYERPLTDILLLQSELAQAIAGEVQVHLTPSEQARLAGARLVNPQAYDAYLMGRVHWNKRTKEGIEKGLEYFRRSLKFDPSYARAYAGISDCHNMLGFWGWDVPSVAFPAAKEAAAQALEIEEGLGEARTALAWVLLIHEWDWEGAKRELKRALEVSPSYTTAHQCLGHYFSYMGRHEESLACVKRTLDLDPQSLIMNSNASFMFYLAGQFELARDQALKTIEIDEHFAPPYLALGWAQEHMGRLSEALAALNKAVELSGGSPLSRGALGRALAISGDQAKARSIAMELTRLRETCYVPAYCLSFLYAGLRDTGQTLGWLETACEERSAWAVVTKVDPKFAEIRTEPRFQELLGRIGFPT